VAENTLPSDAFTRIEQSQEIQGLTRPSLSYWQDAWLRLQSNRRALLSLYLIIGLLLFTVAGPFLWQVDPNAQDVDQISQPPGADRSAMLAAPYEPWYGERTGERFGGTAGAPEGLEDFWFAMPPTTQFVRLQWEPLPGSDGGHRVYRNLYPIGPERAYGLPLFETTPEQNYVEDRLDLQPVEYYYTIVALDADGNETTEVRTLRTDVKRAITASEAIARGLMAEGDPYEVGHEFMFQLHPLGTDYLGRDMLARLIHGARVSLFIGIFAPLFFVLIGVIYGSTAGFLGGIADQGMMRFADFVVALPFLLFMILFKVIFATGSGESGILPMLVAMVVLGWPATARLVRGQILQIREEGYISASRLLGAKTNYLVLRHMIPNTMGVILVTITFAVPSAIFTEAFLSFIGMGVAPPTASWGSMCNEGIKTMLTTPHELIFPAVLISITVLAFNLLGDGLRDALDARMRNRE